MYEYMVDAPAVLVTARVMAGRTRHAALSDNIAEGLLCTLDGHNTLLVRQGRRS